MPAFDVVRVASTFRSGTPRGYGSLVDPIGNASGGIHTELTPSTEEPNDVVSVMLNQDPPVGVSRNHIRDLRRRNLFDVPALSTA